MSERRSPWRLWLLSFLGFWLLSASWAITSAYNGPPDEEAHILRAAGVVNGQILAPTDPATGKNMQYVPQSLVRVGCFVQRPSIPANCTPEPGGNEEKVWIDTSAAGYNPVYYVLTSWPLRFWPDWTGVALSRILSGGLMSVLLACAVVAAVRWIRSRAVLAGLVVAVTPMVFHLGGAINPDAIEIAAGVSLFAALIALLHEQTEGINKATVALAGVSAVAMVTPRFTGAMWLAVICFAMFIPMSKARFRELVRSWTVRWWTLVVVLAGIAAVAWSFAARVVSSTGGASQGLSLMTIVRTEVIDLMWPIISNQMVGVTGWAETTMPRIMYPIWFMAVGMMILGGLALGRRVDRYRLIALFLATFVPLTAAEMYLMNTTGIFNQGRYFLTGAVGLPMLAAYVMARNRLTSDQVSTMTRTFAVILLPFQFVCMVYSLTRYTSGLISLNPYNGSWQPPYGVTLPLVLGAVGVGLQFVVFFRYSKAPAEPPAPVLDDERNLATVS